MNKSQRAFAVVYADAPSQTDFVEELLRQGLEYHQANQIGDAVSVYQEAYKRNPNHPDLLNLLGVAALQMGDPGGAITLIERSIAISPKNAAALTNLGNARLAGGDKAGAVEAYKRSLSLAPDNADSHYNVANVLRQLDLLEEAQDHYQRALNINPRHPQAWFNLGNTLASLKRPNDAVGCFERAAAIAPDLPSVFTNLGVSLVSLERNEEAISAFSAAVEANPLDSQARNNLGCILSNLKRPQEAVSHLRAAMELAPKDIECRNNLARALQDVDLFAARTLALQTVEMAPTWVESWLILGGIQMHLGDHRLAVEAFERGVALDPSCLDENNNLGIAYTESARLDEAIRFYDRIIALRPEDALARADLGITLMHCGEVPDAIQALRRSLEIDPSSEYAHSNLLTMLCYSPEYDNHQLLAEAKSWADVHAPASLRLPPADHRTGNKLRIGYLSADFHAHPAGYLYEAMFPHHDRDRFEIVIYANQPMGDEVTRSIFSNADLWHQVLKEDDDRLAQMVRDDGVDILIDLLGHTPHHRLKAFARKPAPVQATWLGYFGTTGMSQMDFILADKHLLPGEHEPFYTERPARMPGCLYVFQPPKIDVPVSGVPALENGHVTFGCFNNTAKITPDVVALWGEVLRALPTSRMVLNRWPFDSQRVRTRYTEMFTSQGISEDRLELSYTKGREAYFRSYNDVDLMLDTFPYGGGTTTSEALWMGVPVVTLTGDRFAGRMTETILHTVGMSELLPNGREGYVKMALELACDLPRLAALRSSLRQQVESSPLCDLPLYTRQLESTFEWMWASRTAA